MNLGFLFFLESIALGAGLAMDAFSVSVANGMNRCAIKRHTPYLIAGLFALFQGAMPLIGYFLVKAISEIFSAFTVAIPYIALGLLAFIGIKMIIDGIKCKEGECLLGSLTVGALLLQALATSIDALSVGFTIADYRVAEACIAALIVAAVTFIICLGGVYIGKLFGRGSSGMSQIVGGVILIIIGIEIFITGII